MVQCERLLAHTRQEVNNHNEEISYTLGISRPSVFQTRYRLRVKLNLTESTDLDSEVRRIAIE